MSFFQPRRRDTDTATALLAFIAFLAAVALLMVGGLGLFALREVEYRRDRERLDQLDRQFDTEMRIASRWTGVEPDKAAIRSRANAIVREQNAIIRKWPDRLPGRVEQQLLGTTP